VERELKEWLLKNAKPAIGIVKGESTDRSWFGGNPTLPVGFEWPSFRGQSVPFLGQLHLADIPVVAGIPPFPREGTLYFFFAIAGGVSTELSSKSSKARIVHAALHGISATDSEREGTGFAVIYLNGDSQVSETPPPGGPEVPEEARGWRKLLGLKPKWREPRSYVRKPIRFEIIESVSDSVPDDLISADDESQLEELLYGRSNPGPEHQLFGHARPVQSNSDEMIEDVSDPPFGPDDGNWVLLLQVNEDSEAGFRWVDCGSVFFWILEQDLARARFDRVRVIIDFS